MMKFVSAEHEALMAGPGPANQAREAPCAPDLATACRRSLDVLASHSQGLRRQEHFLRAREADCCYLCHSQLCAMLPALPCPHWFIAPASKIERIGAVFDSYTLCDVLHFLLSTLAAEHQNRSVPARGWLQAIEDDADGGLRLRIGRKWWSFQAGTSDCRGTLIIGLLNTRMGKYSSLQLRDRKDDADLLVAVASALREPGS
jgi:hypothetical protein